MENISQHFDTPAFKELNKVLDYPKYFPMQYGFYKLNGEKYERPAIPAKGPWTRIIVAVIETGKLSIVADTLNDDTDCTLIHRELLEVKEIK